MEWINIFGVVFIVIIMIPNMIFAWKCKDGFENKWKNKFVEAIEQNHEPIPFAYYFIDTFRTESYCDFI